MLCVGANVHLDGIVLRAVDKALGHEVVDRFHVTNNLPGAQFAVAAMVAATTDLGYTRIEIACEATGMLWIPFPSLFEHGTALAAVRAGARLPQPKLVAKFTVVVPQGFHGLQVIVPGKDIVGPGKRLVKFFDGHVFPGVQPASQRPHGVGGSLQGLPVCLVVGAGCLQLQERSRTTEGIPCGSRIRPQQAVIVLPGQSGSGLRERLLDIVFFCSHLLNLDPAVRRTERAQKATARRRPPSC
jgi:hypothetical protein